MSQINDLHQIVSVFRVWDKGWMFDDKLSGTESGAFMFLNGETV
jgi:hypothetical protein